MDELERIKRKKLLEMRRKIIEQQKIEDEKKRQSEVENTAHKDPREQMIISWMEPDAYAYLKEIRKRDARVSNIIEQVLMMLVQRGVMRNKLSHQQLLIIERKIMGVGPSIKVKRAGKEVKDFAEELKEHF